jgi:hypothetical protein
MSSEMIAEESLGMREVREEREERSTAVDGIRLARTNRKKRAIWQRILVCVIQRWKLI